MDTGSSGRTPWEGLDRDLLPVKEQLEFMELCLGTGVPVTDLLIPQQHSGSAASEHINDNFPTWATNKERKMFCWISDSQTTKNWSEMGKLGAAWAAVAT